MKLAAVVLWCRDVERREAQRDGHRVGKLFTIASPLSFSHRS